MVTIIILNFNTADQTIKCLKSVFAQTYLFFNVFLVDNGSSFNDFKRLESFFRFNCNRVRFLRIPYNQGFAGGMNRAVEKVLLDKNVDSILLLNSDTYLDRDLVTRMCMVLNHKTDIDMVAARVLRADHEGEIDSYGLVGYRSGFVTSRRDKEAKLLGPCGVCALYSRALIEDLVAHHAEVFDEHFFCYAEDADLTLRALLLGYHAEYADEALLWHLGGASSGGLDSDFAIFHFIRNSFYVFIKDLPISLVARFSGIFIFLHVCFFIKYLFKGKVKLLLRSYRSALLNVPVMIKKRRRIQSCRRIDTKELRRYFDNSVFDTEALRRAKRELWEKFRFRRFSR